MRLLRIVCGVWAVLISAAGANPALEGYANNGQLSDRVKKLEKQELVKVVTLAKTPGGNDIFALTIGRRDADKKPAIAILGNVDAAHVLGSELALRMAERIVADADGDEIKQLLNSATLYVIPRPDPDAASKTFTAPFREVAGNLRTTDDDRDGKCGEDPPDDLNGDGWITQMRVADSTGTWMPHPHDPRVLIEADPKKNERGHYRVLTEGRDNDGDEQFNEDSGDGVALNRNWPHRYQAAQPNTGANAVSEIESRAVADFLYDHKNIMAVVCFSLDDNLLHPWKPDAGRDKQKIRTTVLSADAPYLEFIADKYGTLHGGSDAPEATWPGGNFPQWSYFQFGRWTLSARAWWPPKVAEAAKQPEDGKEVETKPAEKKSEEKRGAADVNLLRWFAQEKLEGFVEWQPIEHPDFPGKKVEVGGFKPYYRHNPPIKVVDELATKHVTFLAQLAALRGQVRIGEVKVEPLGQGLFRVIATVESVGYLPTLSEMGETTGIHQRLQIQLSAAEKTVFLQGSPRRKLGRLEPASQQEITWLLRLPENAPREASLRLWSPELGEHTRKVELK